MSTSRIDRQPSSPARRGRDDAIRSDDSGRSSLPRVFSRPVSRPGLIAAGLFFVMSLLPSLLPRSGLMQGVVSGIAAMVGYGIGAALAWAWGYLGLPRPTGRFDRGISIAWLVLLSILLVRGMWQFVGWQNEVRTTYGMESITPVVWLQVVPVTLLVAAVILIVSRALRRLLSWIRTWLERRLPRRLANLLGWAVLIVLLTGLWSGVLVNGFFAIANATFEPRDNTTDEGASRPTSYLRSGSPDSLVAWDTLGRKGRTFVATGPSVDDLNAFHGQGAKEPIRVYVGLKSAETVQGRADLLLEELKRAGAFEREVLVVATTTGTGYLEPNAMDSLEYVNNGDTAIAGVQYSYLPSWISLLADQEKVKETSQIVFTTIHRYWAGLPEDRRPEIYVYGLSLGSYGVESILTSIDIINEPIDGALMVGPPFVNGLWNELVDNRQPGTSPATPIYEDGRTVRFTNEISALDLPSGAWGETRVVYLQNASDPVVFFSPSLLFTEPDWLKSGQRSWEIAQDFEWVPFVTMWQVLFDLPAAGSVPEGFGHLYTLQANADAWIAVTRPDGWTSADTEALKRYLTDEVGNAE